MHPRFIPSAFLSLPWGPGRIVERRINYLPVAWMPPKKGDR